MRRRLTLRDSRLTFKKSVKKAKSKLLEVAICSRRSPLTSLMKEPKPKLRLSQPRIKIQAQPTSRQTKLTITSFRNQFSNPSRSKDSLSTDHLLNTIDTTLIQTKSGSLWKLNNIRSIWLPINFLQLSPSQSLYHLVLSWRDLNPLYVKASATE